MPQQDLANSAVIVIQGSNMAEAHPVGFQWVMAAKARGATVIHVDPRFTRTSALADLHVPLRAGTDIAFLGGLINHVLTNDLWFREYVVAYTNAGAILREDFQDTEDLDGLFSGFDPESRAYQEHTWQYEGGDVTAAAGQRQPGEPGASASASGEDGPSPRLHDADSHATSRSESTGSGVRRCAGGRGSTTRCSTRGASSRCSSGTTPGTPRRWWRRSAASNPSCSARSPRR